ncbi:hypothetical protein ASG41_04380 [Modestobacter sp. Leaf380]|nr:hypothetical protein ASG41_04380 [Modestobacter sp. Leaf380]
MTYDRCDHVPGPFVHGRKAVLSVGEELVAGRGSNFRTGRVMNHVYLTTEAPHRVVGCPAGERAGRPRRAGHVYVVEPTGPFQDDPNVTDKKFPGNPTGCYRTRHPLRVVDELTDWSPHPPKAVQSMLAGLAQLREQGRDVIED